MRSRCGCGDHSYLVSDNARAMNKNFLKLPSEHFWILTKRKKSQLLTELERRKEVLS